ncbi:hypothetical protein LZ554_003454 [Drepanopeziza brunnea f. sp. 'monogermtubi']|nr:hypothetical protein LZ554_003454 [Drepanopeziza brunnea f. sp. 'monogermtubi']
MFQIVWQAPHTLIGEKKHLGGTTSSKILQAAPLASCPSRKSPSQLISSGEVEKCDFQCFPKLPLELRLMIWRAALPGPRIILIEDNCFWTTDYDEKHCRNRNTFNWTTVAIYRIPTGMHVNQESRLEAQKHYDLAFAKNLSRDIPVYFDYAQDALVFIGSRALRSFVEVPLDKEILALGLVGNFPLVTELPKFIHQLGNPKHTYFMVHLGPPTRHQENVMALFPAYWRRSYPNEQVPTISTSKYSQFEDKLLALTQPPPPTTCYEVEASEDHSQQKESGDSGSHATSSIRLLASR